MLLVPDVLRCGLSRFATVVAAPEAPACTFPGDWGDGVSFPVPALEQHDINHVWLTPAIQKDQYAAVIGRMSDRTVILWIPDGGGNHHNGWYTQPVIIVGNAGGRLRTGRCLTFPNRAHSMAEVFPTGARRSSPACWREARPR